MLHLDICACLHYRLLTSFLRICDFQASSKYFQLGFLLSPLFLVFGDPFFISNRLVLLWLYNSLRDDVNIAFRSAIVLDFGHVVRNIIHFAVIFASIWITNT